MIVKNTLYNILGLGAPLVAAVFSIPFLVQQLGPERFGFLTLIWAIVGYFSLFDLGLGRALTQQLAISFDNNDTKSIGGLIYSASVVMLFMGIFSGLLLYWFAPWGTGFVKGIPDKKEAVLSVYAMALAMPAIVLTSGFRGVLEAKNEFKIINAIRLPMGLLTFLGPVVVIIIGFGELYYIAAILAFGRLFACGVHGFYAWKIIPVECRHFSFDVNIIVSLCRLGGWLTVSNVISPLMSYMDRFIISALLSASAVAYYVTPQELVTKLWIIPGALTAVLFPSFAVKIKQSNDKGWGMFCETIRWLFVIMLPVTLAAAYFSKIILSMWIDEKFAEESYVLLQIFSLGVLVSCLAQIPFTVLQSASRSDITAKIHIVEMPIFLLIMWYLAEKYGVVGAACAWLFRLSIDAVLMLLYAMREFRMPIAVLWEKNSAIFLIFGLLAFLVGGVDSGGIKLVVLLVPTTMAFYSLGNFVKRKKLYDKK